MNDVSNQNNISLKIQDVFHLDRNRGTVICGVALKNISVGDEISIFDVNGNCIVDKVSVKGIEHFKKLIDEAQIGDGIGILLSGQGLNNVKAGQIVVQPDLLNEEDSFSMTIEKSVEISKNCVYIAGFLLSSVIIDEGDRVCIKNDDLEAICSAKVINVTDDEDYEIGLIIEANASDIKNAQYADKDTEDFSDCAQYERIDNYNTNNKSIPMQKNNTFNLLGERVSFNEDIERYNGFRCIFSNNAYKNKVDFINEYNKNVKTFDDILTNGLKLVLVEIEKAIKFGVDFLIQNNIMDYDYNRLADCCMQYIDYSDYIKPLIEVAQKLEEAQYEMNSYQESKKMNRGYWQGGGFGIKGAIKGALMAGTLNLGTDILHSIGDNFASSGDRAKIQRIKNSVYNNKEFLNNLADGVYECCFGVMYGIQDILKDYGIDIDLYMDYAGLNAKFNNILDQYERNRISSNETKKFIIALIQENPFEIEYYIELYKVCADTNKEILKVVEHFGIAGQYLDKITEEDNIFLKKLVPQNNDSKEKLLAKQRQLSNLMNSNPRLENNKVIFQIEEKLNELEKQSKLEEKVHNVVRDNKESKQIVDMALQNNNFDIIWGETNGSNGYAEYVLEKHILEKIDPDINDYNVNGMSNKLRDVKSRADAGNKFAEYLIGRCMYNMYVVNRRNTEKQQEGANIILEMANNNVITAIASKGFFYLHGYAGLSKNYDKAYEYLKKSADLYSPMGMAWLGELYKEGKGVEKNLDVAKKWFKSAADCGQKYAIKQLQKNSSSSTSSSGCFITTAVCDSFNKSDDCYELQTFRSFRDEWLIKQPLGYELVSKYYKIAPNIVNSINKLSDSKKIYLGIWERYLKDCLSYIENQEYLKCKKLYEEMVNVLSKKYNK